MPRIASALVVRALWMKHDAAGAAKEVGQNQRGLVRDRTVLLPNTFAEVFARSPEAQVREAFEALERVGVPPHILADLALALGKKGDLETARSVCSRRFMTRSRNGTARFVSRPTTC